MNVQWQCQAEGKAEAKWIHPLVHPHVRISLKQPVVKEPRAFNSKSQVWAWRNLPQKYRGVAKVMVCYVLWVYTQKEYNVNTQRHHLLLSTQHFSTTILIYYKKPPCTCRQNRPNQEKQLNMTNFYLVGSFVSDRISRSSSLERKKNLGK